MSARPRPQRPAYRLQLLICPVVDQRRPPSPTATPPRAAVVTVEHLQWFSGHYLADDEDRLNPLASPILAELSALPPAHLVLAQTDPQCAAGEQFARLLREAGVPSTARAYPGMFHGFLQRPTNSTPPSAPTLMSTPSFAMPSTIQTCCPPGVTLTPNNGARQCRLRLK